MAAEGLGTRDLNLQATPVRRPVRQTRLGRHKGKTPNPAKPPSQPDPRMQPPGREAAWAMWDWSSGVGRQGCLHHVLQEGVGGNRGQLLMGEWGRLHGQRLLGFLQTCVHLFAQPKELLIVLPTDAAVLLSGRRPLPANVAALKGEWSLCVCEKLDFTSRDSVGAILPVSSAGRNVTDRHEKASTCISTRKVHRK